MINTVIGDEHVIATIENSMQLLESRPAEPALRAVR
jgi:hypothetical protein